MMARLGVVSRPLALAIAQEAGIKPSDLFGRRRLPQFVLPRQRLCWELRLLGWSYPMIGRAIGRDPTTVIWAVRRHEERLKSQAKADKRPIRSGKTRPLLLYCGAEAKRRVQFAA